MLFCLALQSRLVMGRNNFFDSCFYGQQQLADTERGVFFLVQPQYSQKLYGCGFQPVVNGLVCMFFKHGWGVVTFCPGWVSASGPCAEHELICRGWYYNPLCVVAGIFRRLPSISILAHSKKILHGFIRNCCHYRYARFV